MEEQPQRAKTARKILDHLKDEGYGSLKRKAQHGYHERPALAERHLIPLFFRHKLPRSVYQFFDYIIAEISFLANIHTKQ